MNNSQSSTAHEISSFNFQLSISKAPRGIRNHGSADRSPSGDKNNPLHGSADRSPLGDKNIPRGIRNCNPLNIRRGKSQWIGQAPRQTDASFVQFQDLRYGYLAALRLIGVYMSSYGLYTPSAIINRWAPPSENNTHRYIDFVCSETGLGGNQNLSLFDPRLKDLIRAMAIMENGKSWIATPEHEEAIEAAWQEYLQPRQ